MSTKKKKTTLDQLVRCFNVSEPTLHKDGYTVYKISQKIISVNQPDENVQELVVWKRYNDLRRLYKQMLNLHQALHRTQPFPPFAQAKMFGRYEDSVLIERQRSGQDFLNFIAQRSYLVNSPAFQNFFKESVAVSTESCQSTLEPARNLDPCDDQKLDMVQPLMNKDHGDGISVSSEHDLKPVLDSNETAVNNSEPPLVSSLGGVWCHQAQDDDISLPGDSDDEPSLSDRLTSCGGRQSQDPEMSIFDPLGCGMGTQDVASYSNAWLLSALTTVTGSDSMKTESDTVSLDNVDPTADPMEVTDMTDIAFVGNGGVQCGKGDLPSSPVQPSSEQIVNKSTDNNSYSPKVIMSKKSQNTKQSPTKHTSGKIISKSADVTSSPKRVITNQDKGDYIVQANQHFTTAATCEESSDYYMAFNYYKQGIGILLTGVQKDENQRRRNIVRKKTARYLKKAESLHSQNLIEDGSRWHSSASTTNMPSAAFRGHVSELKNLQVLGVIQNVQLVMDKETEKTYILKAVRKPSGEGMPDETLLPSGVPFMVELHRYYETDSAIYLLLQHATGGRLWTYVSSFLSQAPQCPLLDALFNDLHERQLRTANRSPCRLESTRSNDVTTPNTDRPSRARQESHDSFSDCTTSYCALFSTSDDPEVIGHTGYKSDRSDVAKRISVERQISDGFQQMLNQDEPCMELFSINSYENDDEDSFNHVASPHRESPITDEQIDPMPKLEPIISERRTSIENWIPQQTHTADVIETCDDVFTDDTKLEVLSTHRGGGATVAEPPTNQNDHKVAPCSSQSHVLHRQSQRSTRKRTLSSVFSDLDLAADGVMPTSKHLPEACVCRWMAELIMAVSKLHAQQIYCRDLRPDNILLGPRGHVLLSYFCQLTNPREKPLNQCALDQMYAAPELTGVYHTDKTCDWWSVGSIMYELLTGKRLWSCHPSGFTSHTHLYIPEHVSTEAESILRQLLKFDPSERLGGGDGGVDDIKTHPFFNQLDWNCLDT